MKSYEYIDFINFDWFSNKKLKKISYDASQCGDHDRTFYIDIMIEIEPYLSECDKYEGYEEELYHYITMRIEFRKRESNKAYACGVVKNIISDLKFFGLESGVKFKSTITV